MRDSVAADPSVTTLRRRSILSGTIRVDGRTRQHSRRTAGTDYWDIHSYIFPIVSSASFSLLALFQTLRRHWCRLLRQRLNFSSPSRVVVTSDVLGSGKHWSRSDCRANNLVAGKARNRSSLPIGHGVTVPDPDSCRVVTELKTVDGYLSSAVQETDEIPQLQFMDWLMTSVVVQRLVSGRDGADNCGGSAVA